LENQAPIGKNFLHDWAGEIAKPGQLSVGEQTAKQKSNEKTNAARASHPSRIVS
jgi:hypothetical protein